MSQFASCYFCGTALDAQIDPYPVVSDDAGTDDRPTVDLCPVCRRKLSKVLDVALSAADGAETTTPLAAGPDPSPLEADHEDPTAGIGADDEADDRQDAAYAVEPTGEATAVEETDQADADGSAGGADGEDDGPVTATGKPETDSEPTDSTDSDGSSNAEFDAGADDAVTGSEASGTAANNGFEPDGVDEDDRTGGGETEAAEGGSEKPSVLSTPAAQKVIKLLQNREFPVEREEIEVVASNAYEIPTQDCEDVIDTLVSEDYVDERAGKLVRPEE
ncbi:hypothetical protein [Halorientalis sp.]|uniref:hypothetical protein n=1 Tax=Halorientalis sp. TaxID=1931229 RepID=UPI0026101795|nr:hypothetical protein [Halorientalis sp.]